MRRIKRIIFTTTIAILAVSCHPNKDHNTLEIKTGTIKRNNINYYYSQNISNTVKNTPLIVVIDPHGNGKLGVQKFKIVSQNYNSITIGLNNVRNNTPNFNNFIYKAINDAAQHFQIDKTKIYLAGFSGGARMAFQYAVNYACSGLIMCGAGPDEVSNINLPFPLVMITGTRDFNFMEQYYPPNSVITKKPDLIALHFNGIHEWPSESLLLQAYEFISKNMQNQSSEINNYIANSQQLEAESNYLLSFKQLELAYKISKSSEKEKVQALINELISKNDFKNYISSLEQNLKNEISRNQNYIQAIESKNNVWWQKEIMNIKKFSDDSVNILKSDSYARTKAFLGVFLYSKTNQLIHKNNNNALINKSLSVYEQLEPTNCDVFYYKSIYSFLKHDTLNCVKNMKKAFNFGMSDSIRLKKDFPKDIIKLFKQ